MNSSQQNWRINAAKVIHETVDGETLIINTETGVYYSTSSSGAVLWQLLDQGLDIGSLVEQFLQQYRETSAAEAICEEISRFVGELQQEDLLVPVPEEDAGSEPEKKTAADSLPNGQATVTLPFAAPILHKFTDMEEILLMDPIHEVDDTGWPFKKRTL
jgi:coenzyme PQQ synthesis protein D (PqqD)